MNSFDFYPLLPSVGISHDFYWVVVFFAMLGATIAMEQIRKRWARHVELEGWIKMALKERDSTVHVVLGLRNIDDGTTTKVLSAAETREGISSGKLDPRKNIEQLAKRCRNYGRAAEGANAVTVELYDEVCQYGKICHVGFSISLLTFFLMNRHTLPLLLWKKEKMNSNQLGSNGVIPRRCLVSRWLSRMLLE